MAATRPLIMNAGASPTGQAFAIRNCDALFSTISRGISFEETASHVSARAGAGATGGPRDRCLYGRASSPAGPPRVRPSDYYRHCRRRQCRLGGSRQHPGDEERHTTNALARGIPAHPQSPGQWHGRVAAGRRPGLGRTATWRGSPLLGLTGIAVSFVNYLDELPYFCAEVLPRLARSELRDNRTAERIGSL